MIFRLSQKLATRIKVAKLVATELNENPLADWSAHLFFADRTPYVIVSNSKSLYSAVTFATGFTSAHQFITRALDSMREQMDQDGLSTTYQRNIVPSTGNVRFAKALNRSVTGTLNELVSDAKRMLDKGEMSPDEVSLKLNNTLFSVLGTSKEEGYSTPRKSLARIIDTTAL